MDNVYDGLSIKQVDNDLKSQLNLLFIAGALPDHPRPVRTLDGAKRRLSIDDDAAITQYYAYPLCWKHYSPQDVDKLDSPSPYNPTGRM
ncbi:hypothetical protein AAF712_012241 [Marasmius tenuissimus]|uniref:Uncharacterized protein n=1 Tax=Marasmius tenuissimus TaxID=585030 RepID=A0ABR2ZJ25_9AGAR